MNRKVWLASAIVALLVAGAALAAGNPKTAGPGDERNAHQAIELEPASDVAAVLADAEPADDDDDDIGSGPGFGMGGPGRGMGMGPGRGRGLHRMGGRGPGQRLHAALAELDLSDAQREKLAAIHDRQRRKAIPVRAGIETAMLDLHQLLRVDDPDQGAIDRQIDEVAGLRADLRKAQLASLLEARSVLTAEQRKKLRGHFPGLGFMGPMHDDGGRQPGRGRRGMGR